MNIVQCRLVSRDAQVRIELLDRLPIRGSVRRMNVPLHLGMRARSCDLEGYVRGPRHGIVETRECRRRRDIDVVQVHLRAERARFGELAFLENGAHLEVGACVPAPQSAATKGKLVRRQLDAAPRANPSAPAALACARLRAR